jgi:hypothetical protein
MIVSLRSVDARVALGSDLVLSLSNAGSQRGFADRAPTQTRHRQELTIARNPQCDAFAASERGARFAKKFNVVLIYQAEERELLS